MAGSRAEDRSSESTAPIGRIAGHLVNLVLGALILWVGQQTVQHNAGMAAQDERLKTLEKRYDSFWKVLNERTETFYPRRDADAAVGRLSQDLKELRKDLADLRIDQKVAAARHDVKIETLQGWDVRLTQLLEKIAASLDPRLVASASN